MSKVDFRNKVLPKKLAKNKNVGWQVNKTRCCRCFLSLTS